MRIWKEKLRDVDCWMGNPGRGQPASGDADRRSTATQLHFLSEWSNCDCLLSCFDANKKIIFIKHNSKIVFRAILRLTKGSFIVADERKTIEFV